MKGGRKVGGGRRLVGRVWGCGVGEAGMGGAGWIIPGPVLGFRYQEPGHEAQETQIGSGHNYLR